MPTLTDLVPETLRAWMAFELLASSSLSRYARVARTAASHPDVQRAIAMHSISTSELLRETEDSWRFLAGQSGRHEKEVDLALLLAILAKSADRNVDRFLGQVGMRDHPPLSWVSALARSLSFERSASEIARHFVELSWSVYRTLSTIRMMQDPGSVATTYLRAA
jgi:hypothetical protein